MVNNRKTGWEWELVAINYLIKNWYKIIDTNYTVVWWELDIVAEKDWITVFVEVKYRKSSKFWTGEESFTRNKKKNMLFVVKKYCYLKKINEENLQINFISIEKWEKSYKLKHYKNVNLT